MRGGRVLKTEPRRWPMGVRWPRTEWKGEPMDPPEPEEVREARRGFFLGVVMGDRALPAEKTMVSRTEGRGEFLSWDLGHSLLRERPLSLCKEGEKLKVGTLGSRWWINKGG